MASKTLLPECLPRSSALQESFITRRIPYLMVLNARQLLQTARPEPTINPPPLSSRNPGAASRAFFLLKSLTLKSSEFFPMIKLLDLVRAADRFFSGVPQPPPPWRL